MSRFAGDRSHEAKRSGFRTFCGRHSIWFRAAGLAVPGLSVTAYLGLQRYPVLTSFGVSPTLLSVWFLGGIACCILGTVYREDRRNSDTLSLECFALIMMSILIAAPIMGAFFLAVEWLDPEPELEVWWHSPGYVWASESIEPNLRVRLRGVKGV